MDGANRWQTYRWSHVCPQMGPMILLAVTFRLLWTPSNCSTPVFMMTGGGPGSSTYTVSFYLYQIGFAQFHLSEATAGSWMFLYSHVDRHHLPGAPADAHGATLMSYRRNRPGVLSFAMIALFAVFVILPLYWVVITSIKPSDDYLTTPPVFFPTHPTLLHYTAALFAYRGLTGLLNSVIVASATTVLSVLLGACMGYS